MVSIYFVRHGKTEYNVRKALTGIIDINPNQRGLEQSEFTAEMLKDENFDFVFCSPLKRAIETANIINKYHGNKIEIDKRLIERDFGKLSGLPHGSINREILWNFYKDTTLYPDIESVAEVFKRVYSFIDHLRENYDGKKILVVAHSGVFRPFFCYKNGVPEDGNLIGVRPKNASVTIFEY